MVEDLESQAGGLREAGRSAAGTLRVTLSASFGRQHVSALLPQFMALYPQMRLSVHLSDNVVDLVSEGFDLAIRIGALRDSSLVARRLAGNRRVLCAAPDYLRRHGEPATPADLAAHACLLLTGAEGRQDIWRLLGAEGEVAVKVGGPLESNFSEVLRDAALNGQGIALYSVWHVAEHLRRGQLRQVLPQYTLAETGIHAVMPQRRLVPPRVRAFVEFMQVQLVEPPP
ncbi:substrate binding domain-containing protein [Xanthomonas translucens]|uniref:substrate binding domain-containing protein n=1 Tax=Xanthomonas campestris pv. translucens TaxID=343 RepID=UPI000B172611